MNAALKPDRSIGIGASDAPAVLGLSPWRSPLEVFLEKTGHTVPQTETLPMTIGKALEPVILDQFTNETGLPVTDRQRQFIDPIFPWRWATVDGIASDGALVEAKTAGDDREWGDENTDQIPLHYVVQVQHALACSGLQLAWMPVLFRAREFRIFQLQRDDELIAEITNREAAFWQRVQENNPPDAITVSDLRLRYARDTGTAVIADAGCLERVSRLKAMIAALKDAEGQAEQVKAELMAYMCEAAILTDSNGQELATWKTCKGRSYFDAKTFKNAWPELHQKFTREAAPSRQFRIK